MKISQAITQMEQLYSLYGDIELKDTQQKKLNTISVLNREVTEEVICFMEFKEKEK